MKKHFPGHFPRNKVELQALWNKCIFVVDANILLNLYRYSDSTSTDLLDLLSSIKDRLWLPHHAAEEFFANRLSVIGQQEKTYEDSIRTINNLKQNLENVRQHPFVSSPTMRKTSQVFELLVSELQSNQALHAKKITDDPILISVEKLFKDRVGEAYENLPLAEILKEGKSRYAEKIPPGFKDEGKASDDAGILELCRKYGDLLVWFQIIDRAKDQSSGVILVTDDKKDDWWHTFKGKTIGPRPELVQEFLTKTGQLFHMYQADRFLELAREYLQHKIADATVSEIREVRHRDIEAHRVARRLRELRLKRQMEYEAFANKIKSLLARRSMLQKTREMMLHHQTMLQDTHTMQGDDPEQVGRYLQFLGEMQSVEEDIHKIEHELEIAEKMKRRLEIEEKFRRHGQGVIGDTYPISSDESAAQ